MLQLAIILVGRFSFPLLPFITRVIWTNFDKIIFDRITKIKWTSFHSHI